MYTSSTGKFEVKYPPQWKIISETSSGENSVADLILGEDEGQDPQFSVTLNNKEWIAGVPSGESTTLGGKVATLTESADLFILKNYYVQNGGLYYKVSSAWTKEPSEKTLDSMAETFKFLD